MMKGDPIKIHIDPQATPKAVYTAATVPIHWRDVQAQLDQDVALGIIGYNQRYDKIIADMPRKTKCVDDVIMRATILRTTGGGSLTTLA